MALLQLGSADFGENSTTDTTNPDGVRNSGTVTMTTAAARPGSISGAKGYKFDSTVTPTNATQRFIQGVTLGNTAFPRWYFNIPALPSATIQIVRVQTTGGTKLLTVRLTSTGVLQLWNETGTPTQLGADSSAIPFGVVTQAGNWFRLELSVLVPASSTSTVQARINGVDWVASTSTSLGNTALGQWDFGLPSAGATASLIVNADDFQLNDSTGGNENSWPGDSRVAGIMRPTSDGARTGWTTGAGGTTSLFDALDNSPPTGAAAPAATTQIKDTAANTTDSFVANLPTYTAKGFPAGTTITILQVVANLGQAGTTAHSFGIAASNPTVTEFTKTGVSGTAAAAFPTGWQWGVSTPQYSPSLVLGNAPTVTIRKNTSDGVNASYVDAIGLLVVYTGDNSPPINAVTSPVEGSSVSGAVKIQDSASDDVGVTSHAFLLDGATPIPLATPGTSDGQFNNVTTTIGVQDHAYIDCDLISAAAHTFTGTASDAAGNSTASLVNVTVTHPAKGAAVSNVFGWDSAGTVASLNNMETFLNKSLGGVLVYVGGGGGAGASWALIASSATSVGNTWSADTRTMCFSINMLPYNTGSTTPDGSSVATGATGAYNSNIDTILDNLVAKGFGGAGGKTCYIRFAIEYTGTWFPWNSRSAGSPGGGTPAQWNAFAAHWIARIRAKMPNARIVIDPAPGQDSIANVETSLSGLDLRANDLVGMDIYDNMGSANNPSTGLPYTPAERWAFKLWGTNAGVAQKPGLTWLTTYTTALGCKMGVPEWGLWRAGDSGQFPGGDDYPWVEYAYAWYQANTSRIAIFNLFNGADNRFTSGGTVYTYFPIAALAIKNAWGGSATVSPTPPPPTPRTQDLGIFRAHHIL